MTPKLALASVPAGFGPLLTLQLPETALPATWLPLNGEDNNPARFLTRFVAVFQCRSVRGLLLSTPNGTRKTRQRGHHRPSPTASRRFTTGRRADLDKEDAQALQPNTLVILTNTP